jgi:hypothetical protein
MRTAAEHFDWQTRDGSMRILILVTLLAGMCAAAAGEDPRKGAALDSDHDGLLDSQEQALLQKFAPRFMISRHDCSSQPAEFVANSLKPVMAAENNTIYGQAFPRLKHPDQIELHYYDLWRKDCGRRGHDLDAEHVSALLSRDEAGEWKAIYWYAAAHEDTLCDASQIARASAVNAESHGPELWISSGKHAAFLNKKICSSGCGADQCGDAEEVPVKDLVNLGELSAPMNGAIWVDSAEWPLAGKLKRSDFGDARLVRMERLGGNDIAWASPKKRPAQAAIERGDSAIAGVGTGLRASDAALGSADAHTGKALDAASGSTGNALTKAYRGVKKAVRSSAGSAAHAAGRG